MKMPVLAWLAGLVSAGLAYGQSQDQITDPLFGPDNRCIEMEVPLKATRHGIDGWLRGYGRVPDVQGTQSRLFAQERKNVRASYISIPSSIINMGIEIGMQGMELPLEFGNEAFKLNCRLPKIGFGNPDGILSKPIEQKIFFTLACDTEIFYPVHSKCTVGPGKLCTGVSMSFLPTLVEKDGKPYLGMKFRLEDFDIALPSPSEFPPGWAGDLTEEEIRKLWDDLRGRALEEVNRLVPHEMTVTELPRLATKIALDPKLGDAKITAGFGVPFVEWSELDQQFVLRVPIRVMAPEFVPAEVNPEPEDGVIAPPGERIKK